jgi:hypothetical protein
LELQRKNDEAKAQYELIRQTLVTVAFTPNPNEPGPPKPSYTGGTLVDVATTDDTTTDKDPNSQNCTICGKPSKSGSHEHMSKEEIEQSQLKIQGYVDRINSSRKMLVGKIVISMQPSCEATRKQVAGVLESLELLILWQALAMQDRLGPVEYQETATFQEEILSGDQIQLKRKESWFDKGRSWISGLFRSKTHPSHSIPYMGPIAVGAGTADEVFRPVAAPLVPTNRIDLHSGETAIPPDIKEDSQLGPQPMSGAEAIPADWSRSAIPVTDREEEIFDTTEVDKLLRDWTTLDAKQIDQSEA